MFCVFRVGMCHSSCCCFCCVLCVSSLSVSIFHSGASKAAAVALNYINTIVELLTREARDGAIGKTIVNVYVRAGLGSKQPAFSLSSAVI